MADIHWLNPVSGSFNTGTNWSGGTVPGISDNVFLDVLGGAPYTVTESPRVFEQISTLQVAANATLVIGYYDNFQILPQTGTSIGVNAGRIESTGGHSDLLLGQGTFTNTGTIELNNGQLLVQAATATTLNGGGQVILDGGFGSSIGQVVGALVNVDNTIAGGGFISTTMTNGAAGVIDANGVGSALFISDQTITNNGLIESTGVGANLFLDIRRGANVDQSGGGTVLAGNGALVYLEQVTISGGALSSVGTGHFDIGFNNTVLDGSASPLVNKATVDVTGGYTTGQYEATLKGAIVNSGVINVTGARQAGNQTNLIIDSAGVTLTGAGSINLIPGVPSQHGVGASALVGASGGGSVLTNVDNTLAGYGDIGQYALTLINKAAGVIDANAAAALTLDASSTTTNAGLIEATGAGGLTIAGAITNTGALLANGGTLAITGALTNLTGTTLTGGVFQADANSTLNFGAGAQIVTDKATLILNGANSTIQGFAPLEAMLTTIGRTGALEILGGRNWTSTLALSNAGKLQIGGGTFMAPSLANSGTLGGFGVIAATVTNNGVISAQAHTTLSFQGGSLTNLAGSTLTGGKFTVGAGGVLQLANNTSIATLNATIDLAGPGALVQGLNTGISSEVTLASSLTAIGAAGDLQILGGGSFTSAHALANAGTIQLGGGTLAGGTVSGAVASMLTGFGAVASVFSDSGGVGASGGALTFTGKGDTFAGALAGTEIDFSGGTDLLQSGSSLTASAVGVSGGSVVTLGVSQSFAGALTQATGTTLALGVNTLTLSGIGSSLAGAVSGSGTLAFTGGVQAINSGATLSVSNWSVTGGTVTLNGSLTYKGGFILGTAGTLGAGAGDTLALTGAASLSGTIDGTGTVKISNGAISGLTIGGTAILADAGTVNQSGALTIGDSTAQAATLRINTGATYTVQNDASITRGAATASAILNSGTLTNSGTGTTLIAVSINGAGSVVAATGVLELTQALTGTAALSVDSGATLRLDSSTASTLSVTFNGGNAVLALLKPFTIAATINGFAPSDTIDLLARKATAAVLAAGDKLLIENGTKTIATLQLAGSFTGETFNVASDGHGGTNVTITVGGANQNQVFIAAMAGWGSGAGPPIDPRGDANAFHSPILSAPRVAMA